MRKASKLAVLGITVLGLALAGPADNSLIVGASQEPRVLAGEVLALGERPLLPGLPYLEGEVV
jgi:peptide/nickel transport system substrate-binding protein